MTEDAMGLCRDCGGWLYESGHTCPVVEADCGCYTVDGEQKLWCAPHIEESELVRAREREAWESRRARQIAENERDEWKAKAERALEQAEHYEAVAQEHVNKAISLADENRGLRSDIHGKSKQLQEATHYCCYHMRWETREGAEV